MTAWMLVYLRLWAACIVISGVLTAIDPRCAACGVLLALGGAIPSWRAAWRNAEQTALRGALVWAGLGIVLGVLAQVQGFLEVPQSGRPWTGRITYLMVLALLAALISVLGARNPGGKAWAILMVLLMLVFLIPWLEAGGRLRRAQGLGQVQLDSPWTVFYGLLVLAGVTNFVPTRYCGAALSVGAGFIVEYLALTRGEWTAATRAAAWPLVAWTLALGWFLGDRAARRPSQGRGALEDLWFWFRDHWGVVWGLRVQERFDRAAELAHWPARLTWFGLVSASAAATHGVPDLPEQAETTLRTLLRRFVAPDRADAFLNTERDALRSTGGRAMMKGDRPPPEPPGG